MMYKYFKRNRFSTKSSDIKDDSGKIVGTIQKKFNNIFQRLVSFFTLGFKFNRFVIYDHNGDVKASVKVKTIMAQKRFDVTYVSNNGESQVLFDKQSNGRGETYGILKFDVRILNIHSDVNKYTVIKDSKQDKEIASWKQNGDYAYVEGKSELYEKNHLLFILILHSFANVHVSHSILNPFNPDTTGSPII